MIIQEVMRADVPWRDDVVSATFPIVDGHITAPTGAGWGISVDEQAAAEHPYIPEPLISTRNRDGSVADW